MANTKNITDRAERKAKKRAQRKALKRAVEEIQLLPEQEQVHAARRVVRRIKGPASRIAATVVERTVEPSGRSCEKEKPVPPPD